MPKRYPSEFRRRVLDRGTGDLVCKTNLPTGGAVGGVMSTAAVGDSEIHVASNSLGTNGTIFALDATNGSILWQHETGEPIYGGSMALGQ